MLNGFYRRRRGILEHLLGGVITLFDAGVHDFLCLNAQSRAGIGSSIPPGIWIGSAKKIWLLTGRNTPLWKIKRSLAKLKKIGWIKWFHFQGQRGDYPILIARFVVTDDRKNDFVVNAESTLDWRHPVLEPISRFVPEAYLNRTPPVPEAFPLLQEVRLGNQNTPAATQPADHRHQVLVEHAHKTFEAKHSGLKPSWTSKDYMALSRLLKPNPHLTSEELERRWNNFLASTEDFTRKQGDSLAFFCSRFDSFINGPLPGPGGSNGTADTRGSFSGGTSQRPATSFQSNQAGLPFRKVSKIGGKQDGGPN